MKKCIALLLLLAMLTAMGTVMTAAALPDGVSFTPGKYCCDAEDFSPVGTVKITWDPNAAQKLDLSDADMSDWADAGYDMINIDAANMVSWVGDRSAAPAGWNINAYFVIDPDYLYIGFYVTDPNFAYATEATGYNGDAIQLALDFGGKLGDQIKTDPDVLSIHKNIFYSFSCVTNGAPLEIHLQESDQDGMLSEANGAGVKGSASKTETGWCAEFALSLDMMFEHYKWKAWDDDAKIYIGSDLKLPFKIGCCLYYLDRSEPGGPVNWAAGTTNGIVNDQGVPQVSWSVYDNGINLELDYVEGMEFSSPNIVVIPVYETVPEGPVDTNNCVETDPPPEIETDFPPEIETQPPSGPDTTDTESERGTSPTTRPESGTTGADPEEELELLLKDLGCSAVMGMGSLTALLVLAAVGYVIRKRK